MPIRIIENDSCTIKATAWHDNFDNICDEDIIFVEAEYEPAEAGTRPSFNNKTANLVDPGTPGFPSSCEITRVYIPVSEGYEQNLDIGQLYHEINDWEEDIIEAIEELK
jgi:hypothetical protein